MLDAFTARNGATRVVPGSHRASGPLQKSIRDPAANHPRQELVTAPAGSVLVFNGHLWHSGTRNESDGPRRALQLQYVASASMPPSVRRAAVPSGLSAGARILLAL
jgi:ectoine hydroxylase-related dioxygenase (phytanoyl-CoA dioxygenase family)